VGFQESHWRISENTESSSPSLRRSSWMRTVLSAALSAKDDREDYGEERWITVGLAGEFEVTVLYTARENRTRIISARKADSYERQAYWNR
jgi:uncharacterized DUF497 family protein